MENYQAPYEDGENRGAEQARDGSLPPVPTDWEFGQPDPRLFRAVKFQAQLRHARWSFPAGGKVAVCAELDVEVPASFFRELAGRMIAESKETLRQAGDRERACKESGTLTPQDLEVCQALGDVGRLEAEQVRRRWEKMLLLLKDAAKPRRTAYRIDFPAARAVPIDELLEVRMGFARCPSHSERTPSLKVYDDNHVHCFGCGFHGSAVDVAMAKWNVGPREAAERLNRGER